MRSAPLAICYALREEIKPLLKGSRILSEHRFKLTLISRAEFCGVPLLFCQTGMGMNPAHEGAERLIENFHPSLILSVGYAGGVDSSLMTGDLLLASEILSETQDLFETDKTGRDFLEMLIREEQLSYRLAPLLTRWEVADREAKSELAKKGVVAVDIESAALAAVARETRTPLVSLRAIFDAWDDEMPFRDLTADASRPAEFLLKNPKSILSIPKFFRMNQICRKNLSRVLARFIDCHGK